MANPDPPPRRCWTTLVTRSSYIPGALLLAHSLHRHGTEYSLVLLYTPTSLSPQSIELLRVEARLNPVLRLRETTHLLPPRKVDVISTRFEDTWTKLRCFSLYDKFTINDDEKHRRPAGRVEAESNSQTLQKGPTDEIIDRLKDEANDRPAKGAYEHVRTGFEGYDEVCYLDADMLVLRPGMDELFTDPICELPPTGTDGRSWVAATHACVCNLDHDPWAAEEWKRVNCAYTPLRHPEALSVATPVPSTMALHGDSRSVPRDEIESEACPPHTHTLLNSGLFIFRPTRKLYFQILEYLATSPLVEKFAFPDQDLITEFFRDRWIPLSWKYNALKTWRYWHGPHIGADPSQPGDQLGNESAAGPAADRDPYAPHPGVQHEAWEGMWRDEEVINLHYIVDKPWSSSVQYLDGYSPQSGLRKIAGYLGRDGETHAWWWREWEGYVSTRRRQGEDGDSAVGEISKLVADRQLPPA